MKDLVIIILTFNIDEIVKPARFLPKVCHKIEDKTMIEMTVENCLKLNPIKIILYVSKNNIQCINKVLKHANYSKVISFCIFDNELNGKRRMSIGQKCFSNKNVLVIPGNAPHLSSKTLFRMTSNNTNVKIRNNLFYLKNDSLHLLNDIENVPNTDFHILEKELKQVETKGDLDEAEIEVKERNKRLKKFRMNEKNDQ